MRKLLALAFLGLPVAVVGLDPAPAAEKEFILRYRKAHEAKDIQAVMKMVHWAGVEEDLRRLNEAMFKSNFDKKLADAGIEPLKPGELLEYSRGGVTYGPNLKPIGRLQINFEKSADGFTGTSFLVGVKDGRYFITTAAPITAAAKKPAVKIAAAGGAEGDWELAGLFRRAHETKNAQAVLALVYWSGVPEFMRDFLKNAVTQNFTLGLKSVEIHALDGDEHLESALDGAVHRPNLAPSSSFRIEYENGSAAPAALPELFVGTSGGRSYLVMRVPAAK